MHDRCVMEVEAPTESSLPKTNLAVLEFVEDQRSSPPALHGQGELIRRRNFVEPERDALSKYRDTDREVRVIPKAGENHFSDGYRQDSEEVRIGHEQGSFKWHRLTELLLGGACSVAVKIETVSVQVLNGELSQSPGLFLQWLHDLRA